MQRLKIGLAGLLPEQRIFGPLRETLAVPPPPEEYQRGEQSKEGGELAGSGQEHGRDGGEVDHCHRVTEEQHPDHLFAGQVGAGEGELAPIAEEAFEAEERDQDSERGDGESAEPTQDGDRGGQAGQIHGDDAPGDDETLHGGQPGGAAFLVGGLEHPVGLQGDRDREKVAQGEDHKHGEPQRRSHRH